MVRKKNLKTSSYNKGKFAENYIALWLRLKGYRILEKRFKTAVGEIDLLAFKNNQLIAIEVKARKTEESARHSISETQWRRIARSTQWYQKKNNKYYDTDIRFDAIFLLPFNRISRLLPLHIQNAWQPPSDL